LFSENNFEFSSVWESQSKGILQHDEIFLTYLLQYAN
jgi:hypothetical protein